MGLPTRLSKGVLPFVFGLVAVQGAAAPAAAQSPSPLPPDTAASQELASLSRYYQSTQPNTRIVVINPDVLASQPQNLDEAARLQRTLAASGLDITAAEARDLTGDWFETENGVYTPNTSAELAHQVYNPRVAFVLRGRQYVCLVMPADPTFYPYFDGMTAQENRTFINRHEFRHCADRTLAGLMLASRGDDHSNHNSGFTRTGLTETATVIRTETMADLGALSDMIALDGSGLGVIDAVTTRREQEFSQYGDVGHYSAPALVELRARIDSMGIEAYRALSSSDRDRLNTDICADHCITAGAIAAYGQHFGQRTPAGIRIRAQDEALAADMAASLIRGSTPISPGPRTILTEAEAAELNGWDAAAALNAIAGRNGSSISEFSLVAARNELIDDLRAQILAEPDNPLHGARLIMTDRALQQTLAAPAPAPATARQQPQPSVTLGAGS